jgi:hypothetical protein
VQAFERARLVAADVVAELVPLGELDEYVNLSPTTGPVPVMVPASKLADASAISDDALRARQRAEDADAPADAPSTDSTRSIDRLLADKPAATPNATDEGPAVDEATEAATDDVHADTADSTAPVGSEPPVTAVSGATVLQFPGGVTRGDFARSPSDSAEAEESESGDDDEPEPGSAEVSTDDEIDDDEVTATDVDDLFARLRTQGPAASEPEATTEAGDAEVAPTPFDRRDEALTPLIVSSARKLKRVLADEQNTVLDRLRHADPVRSLDDIIADAADHGARYFDIVEDDLMAAAEAGADSLGGATLDAGEGGVLAPIRQSLLGDLIMPLRDRLADRIAAGDGDNEAITKSVRSVYREWKTKHIDDHLDDLLLLSYGRGAFAALEPGELCRWVFDPAVGPCSDCEDNSLQGEVPVGTAFPTGHVAAPAHAGCRCLLARSGQ